MRQAPCMVLPTTHWLISTQATLNLVLPHMTLILTDNSVFAGTHNTHAYTYSCELYAPTYLISFSLLKQFLIFIGTKTIEIHPGLPSLTSFLNSTGLCSLHAWLLLFFSRSVFVTAFLVVQGTLWVKYNLSSMYLSV